MRKEKEPLFIFEIIPLQSVPLGSIMQSNNVTFEHETSMLLQWSGWRSILLIVSLSLAGSVTLCINCAFIRYIWFFAEAKRPINSMIVTEQVCIITSSNCQETSLNFHKKHSGMFLEV